MSGTPTAEAQAAEDEALVAETLGRFEQQWLPAQMQDNNALALANAWRDCDNMLSRFTRGDPITSDYSDFRSGIWTQQDRLKDWGTQLGFPRMLDPNDHGPLDPRLTVPRLTQGAFDFLDDIVKSVAPLMPLSRRHMRSDLGSYPGPPSMSLRISSATRWHRQDKKTFVSLSRGIRECINLLFVLLADADAYILLNPVPRTVEGPSKTERVAETSHGGFANKPTTSSIEEPNEVDKPYGEKSSEKSDNQQPQFRNLTTKDDHESNVFKQLDEKDHLRGMLWVSVAKDRNLNNATLSWEGVNSKDVVEKQQEMEYANPIHPSWSLMYATAEMNNGTGNMQRSYSEQDSEASRKFEGKWPGTRTVQGFAADLSDWEHNSQPTSEGDATHTTTSDVPNHSISQLVEWLDELQQHKTLLENRTEQSTLEYMQKLLGPINTQRIEAPTYELDHQIQDLLVTLNRADILPNYNDAVSPAKLWVSGDPMRSEMLFRMIVAYELKLRLEQTTTNFTMNNQVTAAIEMAGRWIKGVHIKNVSGPEYEPYYDFEELVHDEQIEGLVRFAELMEWPGLDEMPEFLEPRGATVLPSAMGTHKLLDWTFGTVLPGSGYVCTIMPALVLATPSLLRMGEPAQPSAGLVLNGRSYWRFKHVLGRVFGGMKGIKAANGWVGPCPPVLPNDGQVVRPGWWRIQEKDVPFDQVPKEPAETSNLQGLDEPVKWVGTIPPRNSPTKIKFSGLQFLRAKAADPRDVVDEPRRAVLTFQINKAPIASLLELKYNPTFVAAPRCIDGPHLIDLGDLPRLENVVDVADIGDPFKSVPEDERVLIIDATGDGDCELLARAWCSMEGRHAVIARAGEETCFTCAVRAAGDQGLGLGCLIWG
ncbi:hypothetical protein Neosp_011171 [[Neocosmospora] mangrovei]